MAEESSKNTPVQAHPTSRVYTKNIDPSKPICCQKDSLESFCRCGKFADECTTCSKNGDYMGFIDYSDDALSSIHIIFPEELSVEESKAILSSIRPDIPSSIAHPNFIKTVFYGCVDCDKFGFFAFHQCTCDEGDHSKGPTFTTTLLNEYACGFDDYHVTIFVLQEILRILIKDHGCQVTGFISWRPFSYFHNPKICKPSEFGMLICMGDRLFQTEGVKEIGETSKESKKRARA